MAANERDFSNSMTKSDSRKLKQLYNANKQERSVEQNIKNILVSKVLRPAVLSITEGSELKQKN